MVHVLLGVSLLLLSRTTASRDECSLEDVHFYEKTESRGDPVQIYTRHCADFTVRNTSDGSRFDPTVEATFTDGTSAKEKLRTPRLDPSQTHPGDLCFGGVRIRKMTCSW